MGCFLGCFGFSSKRQRRKPANRIQPGDQGICSYEPLDSASANLDKTGEPINSDPELSKKAKEPLNHKLRKKVSFNLNVQSYEPIPKQSTNNLWESDEEEKKEEISRETARETQSLPLSQGDSIAEKMASYPSNYRYKNCNDSYDEEDEIAYEESDLDDEEDDDFDEDKDDDNGGDIDNLRICLSEEFRSLSVSSQKRDSLVEFAEEKSRNLNFLGDPNEGGLKSVGMNRNARDRSQYVHPVLNPVENLSQWKAVKAREKPPVRRQRKENVALEQEIAVDASLSNWLVSVGSCHSKNGNIPVETISSSKKSSLDRPFSWRNREDMPILDMTNLQP